MQGTPAQTVPVYDSDQVGSPAMDELRQTIRYRHLIVQFIRRDILTRYKRSVLGVAWTMLNPLGIMLIMTFVFSLVFGRDATYRASLLSGLIAWNFFQETTNGIMRSLVWGAALLERIYVPRTAFAISSLGSGLINLGFSVIPLLLVMALLQVPVRPAILFLPVPALLLAAFCLGLGLILSVVAIYFADIAEMYKVGLRAWFYLTPIIYPEAMLQDNGAGWLLQINPLYHLITLFRIPLRDGRLPTLLEMLPGLAIALGTLLIGWILFSRRSDEFAYRV